MTFFISACGGDGDGDACTGVTCERGVCSDGQCTNAASCGGADENCLDGYECSDADVCEARVECTGDDQCGGGVCENDACVNPEKCAVDANCVPGDICVDEACAPDPCGGCDRGVCDVASSQCVNSDVCTSANEDDVCLEGSKCIQQACQTEAEFCGALDCSRGTCSFEEEACVNADNCEGADTACLDGFFCGDDNTCAENNCNSPNQCTMGVCDRASGDCVNAEPCDAASQCTDGFVCVTDTCVETANACDPACTGNQECVYDGGSLSATCEESGDGCSSALDCTGDRVCDAGACADPTACTDDAYEDNDVAADATVFADAATNSRINEASVCGGDVDLYTFDTTADADGTGTLFVDVMIADADVGLGILDVSVTNSGGMVVASGSTSDNGAAVQSVQLEYGIDALNGGVYTVTVEDSGDVSTAGVRYTLSVDVVDSALIAACSMPQQFALGTPVVGNTNNAGSTALTGSCADADGNLNDSVHTITIDEDSFVNFRAVPGIGVDVSLSVRSVCSRNDSELGCSDAAGAEGVESVSGQYEAGTYTVIVQPSEAGLGGSYTLSADAQPVICSDADNTCLDAQTANDCNDNGTAFDMVTCDNGCDSAIGACSQPPGEVCQSGFPVDENNPFNGPIAYANYANDYDPAGACAGVSSGNTQGPDAVWTVTVPDGETVVASIVDIGNGFDDMSLYIVEDCSMLGACLAGSDNLGNAEPENTFWTNESGMTKTVYVVADTDVTISSYSSIQADIRVETQICTPGATRCVLNRESQTCNVSGTAFDSSRLCGDDGCDAATGECVTTNDTCTGAQDVTPVLTAGAGTNSVTLDIADYTNTNQPSGCPNPTANGPDAVYLLSGLPVNSSVTVYTDDTSGLDSVLYVKTDCTNDTLGTCIDSRDDPDTSEITFLADGTTDYYVVVDMYGSSSSSGAITLTVEVDPPVCTPGTFLGCNAAGDALQFCTEFGQTDDYSCTCTPGANSCDTPEGAVCVDAIPLAGPSGQVTGGFASSQMNSIELSGGVVGSCGFDNFDESDGYDTIYAVDLSAGEVLTADFTSTDTTAQFYLQENCGSNNSCIGYYREGDSSISYYATSTTTVYMVADNSSTFASSDTFTIDYVIQSGLACAPGEVYCSDPNTVRFCSADGFNFTDYACAGGCSNGVCQTDVALADTCGTAPNIGSGAAIWFNPDDYTDTESPTCADSPSGGDAFYEINVTANDIVRIVGASVGFERASTYIFTDCLDVEGTCAAGATASSTDFDSPVIAQYQAQSTGTLLIGLDADLSSYDEPFYFTVEVVAPECLNSDAPFCNSGGDGIRYCDGGLLADYPCSTTCTAGVCDDPSGNSCFDPIVLDPLGGSITGADWSSSDDLINIGDEQVDACLFENGGEGDGGDNVYSISLAAGDVFEATVETTESDTLVYLLSDCAAGTCVASDPVAFTSDVDRMISYRADAAGTFFLVVDRDDSSSSGGDYDLSWSVTQGQTCAPNAFTCIDANTLGKCNADGTAQESISCPNGCADGFCTVDATADACGGNPVVTDGFYGWWNPDSNWVDDINLGSGDCAGTSTPGEEVIFEVPLAANEILRARIQQTYNFDDAAVYIFQSCADPAGSCQIGAEFDSSDAPLGGFVEYQAGPTPETVFVAFDTTSSFDTDPFFIEITKEQPNCTPGAFTQVCDSDNSGFEYCNDRGFITTYECVDVGGIGCSNGACLDPRADVCLDPGVLNPDSVTGLASTTGVLADVANDYDLRTGNLCTASVTPGNDGVYAVDLVAGDVLTANLVSTESPTEDLALYLTTDCGDLPDSCVGDTPNSVGALGSDVVGAGDATAESVTYTATSDERVYIVVDSFFSSSTGGFSVDIEVQ